VIVRFVDIGEIDDHHCLNFLFTVILRYKDITNVKLLASINTRYEDITNVKLLASINTRYKDITNVKFIYSVSQNNYLLWF
jgi:hypothetical protein